MSGTLDVKADVPALAYHGQRADILISTHFNTCANVGKVALVRGMQPGQCALHFLRI